MLSVRVGCSDSTASTMYSKKVSPASRCMFRSNAAGSTIMNAAVDSHALRSSAV